MLYTEDFTMRHYVGFLQIGSKLLNITCLIYFKMVAKQGDICCVNNYKAQLCLSSLLVSILEMGVYSTLRLLVGVVSIIQSKDESFALTRKDFKFLLDL